ncbi:MAG: cohesin domain-containing protein, partial [Ginsengibacter sp.]
MQVKNKFIIYGIALFVYFISFSAGISHASAATLNLSPSSGSYEVGDIISVKVYVNSEQASINAVSGTINFSASNLKIVSVSKSGSMVSLWAQEPYFSNTAGSASFEGVVLNGYEGSAGTILTLVFKVLSTGTASIKFPSASILANDGQGTNILSGRGEANFSLNPSTAHVEQKPAPKNVAPETPVEPVLNPVVQNSTTTPVQENFFDSFVKNISNIIPASILT